MRKSRENATDLKIEPALEAIKGENDRILGMIKVCLLLVLKAIFR